MSKNDQLEVHLLSSSFRDPNSFLFTRYGVLYRQINEGGLIDYQRLLSSDLYKQLVNSNYLIPHKEVPVEMGATPRAKVVIQPEKLEFISYPYEWSFSQLKDAALLTLDVAITSLNHGMILKDASAYNVQFYKGKPVFIDTGSFEEYQENEPWVAYNQFCMHFLAPLALMAKRDIRLGNLSRQYIDGAPLDLASRLLPLKSWLSYSLLTNIHLHAITQSRYGDSGQREKKTPKVSRMGMFGLLSSLRKAVHSLTWKPIATEWGDYYNNTNYSSEAAKHKGLLIDQFVTSIKPKTVWDLGGNNGHYSRIASKHNASVVCWDIDPMAVEANYRHIRENKETTILPLLLDLTNPSPDLGWANKERGSLQTRGPVDLVMGLALVHHLAISNNVPLRNVAEYFAHLAEYLIIEFVPKDDSQVKRLLSSREDVFPDYDIGSFELEFTSYYQIIKRVPVEDSYRTLFLMKKL